jgi:hypothetical protein
MRNSNEKSRNVEHLHQLYQLLSLYQQRFITPRPNIEPSVVFARVAGSTRVLGRQFGSGAPGKPPRYCSGRGVRVLRDEFSGAFTFKEPILLYRNRNTVFHSLNFIRFHYAAQFFD